MVGWLDGWMDGWEEGEGELHQLRGQGTACDASQSRVHDGDARAVDL